MWQRSCPPWMLCPPWTQMWSRPHPQTWPRPLFSVDAASEGQHPPPCRSPDRTSPYLQGAASSRRPADWTMQCRSVRRSGDLTTLNPTCQAKHSHCLCLSSFLLLSLCVFFAVCFSPSISLAMRGLGHSSLKGGRAHCPVCFVSVFLPTLAELLLPSKFSLFVGHRLVKGCLFLICWLGGGHGTFFGQKETCWSGDKQGRSKQDAK